MFIFSKNTKISSEETAKPVEHAISMLERDKEKVFMNVDSPANQILIQRKTGMKEEQYTLEVTEDRILVLAGDDLGLVYGILHISEHFLGIKPFWFWMDQIIEKKEKIEIQCSHYESKKPIVHYRGWFFNDEVLMMRWKWNQNGLDGWKIAFETLLRCGGNLVIPGTDKMSVKNRALASEMGLWITHHHAEPLGAEMFVRAYPDIKPNYMEHPDLFCHLWEESVIAQKDYKVIWNLCFRGQGDSPFWSNDTTGQFDTPKKQGNMISELIQRQCEIVKKHVKNPVFCTNLYGEIMELYEQGHIRLDPDIIKVRADNGYGKMVTRRRDNHSVRVSSMPDKNDQGAQGIYYHVSFYDLQAANHITMLPNSVSFVNRELTEVINNKGGAFWVINCSNVRPHVYYLDAIRKKWLGRDISDSIHSREFIEDYYNKGCAGKYSKEQIARCYEKYPEAMIPYGEQEDEHMGEQFYTENLRIIVHQTIVDKTQNAKALYWFTGGVSLEEQVKQVCAPCRTGLERLENFYYQCEEVSAGIEGDMKVLFDAVLFLQTKIHYFCAKGVVLFGDAYEAFQLSDYRKAFVLFGKSAELFDEADKQMRNTEYGVWEDFYLNDCFADVKHTAYMIRKMMGFVRELGDNVRHDKWYRDYCYPVEDQNVFLLLITDNHMTDRELYEVMKEKAEW